MLSNTIQLVIEGHSNTEGHVDLKVFLEQLSVLKDTLGKFERHIYVNKTNTRFLITNLSHSSPATVTLQANAIDKENDLSTHFIDVFNGFLGNIVDGKTPGQTDYGLLESLQRLTKPVTEQTLASTYLLIADNHYAIDQAFSEQIENMLESEESCLDRIEGALEQINLHGSKKQFTIYPSVGPTKVQCVFPDHLYEQVLRHIDQRVCVEGEAFYRPKAAFPHKIVVDRIEAMPDDDELPTFRDMLGIATGFKSDTPSEDIIRENRDEWE